ncbi:hypothetical protein KI387_040437, partial [Taxus chinensis]
MRVPHAAWPTRAHQGATHKCIFGTSWDETREGRGSGRSFAEKVDNASGKSFGTVANA